MREVKLILIASALLVSIGTASAAQPKILEAEDSLGNQFNVEPSGDGLELFRVEEELVISNETELSLCITEVSKDDGDTIEFQPRNGNNQWNSETCKTWEFSRDDYGSEIRTGIEIRNQDEIFYASDNYDYRIEISYENLVLPDSSSETSTESYDTTQISSSELEDLRDSNEEKTEKIEELEAKLDSKKQEIEDDQSRLEEKNTRISNLESQISDLQDTIEAKTSTISTLQQKIETKNEKISNLKERKSELKANVTELTEKNTELRNRGLIDRMTGYFFK